MKRQKTMLTTVMLFLMSSLSQSGGKSATALLAMVDAAGKSQSSKLFISQRVTTPTGEHRDFKMISYSLDGTDKGLTEYLAPSQIRGMKILTLNDGDDIWTYFPRTNRVRKIASSARNRKVQGSDFTYDDMASGKLSKSWSGSILGHEAIDKTKCIKLSLKPTSNGPKAYKKATVWINEQDNTLRRILYYDRYGDKLKRLDISEYKKINGVAVPMKYVMENLQDGGKTVMTVHKAEINIPVSPDLFNQAGLSK